MTIVVDENLPRPLKAALPNHTVKTVQELRLAGTRNGQLLALLEGAYDIFITADKNLRYQQNLSGRALAILELPTNRLPVLRRVFQQIAAAVETIQPGEYMQLCP